MRLTSLASRDTIFILLFLPLDLRFNVRHRGGFTREVGISEWCKNLLPAMKNATFNVCSFKSIMRIYSDFYEAKILKNV